jgi:hypothetical protein
MDGLEEGDLVRKRDTISARGAWGGLCWMQAGPRCHESDIARADRHARELKSHLLQGLRLVEPPSQLGGCPIHLPSGGMKLRVVRLCVELMDRDIWFQWYTAMVRYQLRVKKPNWAEHLLQLEGLLVVMQDRRYPGIGARTCRT